MITGEDDDLDKGGIGKPDETAFAATDDQQQPNEQIESPYESHFRNFADFPASVRWGIPIFLLATFVLLLNADIGSGVTADSILMQDGEVVEINSILNVSVISSVGKLWNADSYPLAILIAVTSVGWPYLKLALAAFAWMMPYRRPRSRELLIEIIDALGKWSFVDIMVLVEIMVAFRSSVVVGPGLTVEIVIVAQWGFYGFVIATMMSLLSTHVILHFHRQVHYHPSKNGNSIVGDNNAEAGDNDPPNVDDANVNSGSSSEKRGMKALGKLSTRDLVTIAFFLVLSIVFYLVGVLTKTFEVTSTRGETVISTSYSITSIGMEIPEAYVDSGHTGTRFIQIMWFFLGVVMLLYCSFLFLLLYLIPSLSNASMERIFTMAEIAFAWSCAEVLFLSTIFAVLQMPIFGDGLVENDCTTCFLITTRILPEFAFLSFGTVLNVVVNVWLYRKAHGIIYHQA